MLRNPDSASSTSLVRTVVALVALFSLVDATGISNTPLLTVGLVADNHYDTFPAGEQAPWEPDGHWLQEQLQRVSNPKKRRYDVAKDKMDEAVDVFNRVENLTFVVNLGDLVNNDMMWNLRPILDSFNRAKVPKFNILGNHDLRAHNDRFGKHNATQHTWVRTKFGLNHGKWYYRINYPPFVLLFFDSMVMEASQPDQSLKKEHMDWVSAQLADAKARKFAVIIFAHISIGLDTNPLGKVLKEYEHIVAAFFGHEHKGGYYVQNGIHCVILQGQIETLTNAFAVMEAFEDRIELTGFGRVPSRTLSFSPGTQTLLRAYHGVIGQDIASQGYQPLPPAQLWEGEVLQKPPPLNLKIPTYRKPKLPPTDPNPGNTRFLLEEYRRWPKRVRTPSPEDPVDLNDFLPRSMRGKGTKAIGSLGPAAGITAEPAGSSSPFSTVSGRSSSAAVAPVSPLSPSAEHPGVGMGKGRPGTTTAKNVVHPKTNPFPETHETDAVTLYSAFFVLTMIILLVAIRRLRRRRCC